MAGTSAFLLASGFMLVTAALYAVIPGPLMRIFTQDESVADVLGCRTGEIVFTSGGTESVNLAVKGAAAALQTRRHVVTSRAEHLAAIHTALEASPDVVRIIHLRMKSADLLAQ